MFSSRKKNKGIGYIFFVIFLICVFSYSGCNKDDSYSTNTNTGGTPGANEVFLQSISYSPSTKTVSVGTTIKWIDKVNVTHTVTSGMPGSPDGVFNSGDLTINREFSHTFTQTGTFHYYCMHHAGMTGTIVVQ